MATIADCAVLSHDVYLRTPDELVGGAAWTRRDPVNWNFGFAAGTYTRDRPSAECVVAFRGTDTDPDWDDIFSDLMMVPAPESGQAGSAVFALLDAYGVANEGAFTVAPEWFDYLLSSSPAQSAIRRYANRIPDGQTALALDYFDRAQPRPSLVVGHSLGGALAKVVAERRGLPAVAFNSPFMGTLSGSVPATSAFQISVNADRDPLSLATRAVGNHPHGEVITVTLPPPPETRPDPSRHPLFPYILLGAGGIAARELEYQRRRHVELVAYALACAGYYHSIDHLRKAVLSDRRFRVDLGRRFGG